MYGPHVAILLMCVSRNMRHIDFRRLTSSQRTPGKWGVTMENFYLQIFAFILYHSVPFEVKSSKASVLSR